MLEFFGGLAIALGVFTRYVAFVVAGEMAVTYFWRRRRARIHLGVGRRAPAARNVAPEPAGRGHASAVRGFAPMNASHSTTMNSPKYRGMANLVTVSIAVGNTIAIAHDTT